MPEIGVATLELLERLGVEVHYPLDQTCCGQPMANAGCHADAAPVERQFLRCFEKFDCVVTPSSSCAHHVRARKNLHSNCLELSEFLHDVLKVREFPWARLRTGSGFTSAAPACVASGSRAPPRSRARGSRSRARSSSA